MALTTCFVPSLHLQILGNLSNSELSPEDSTGLFTLFLEWILASENPLLVEFGHKYLG